MVDPTTTYQEVVLDRIRIAVRQAVAGQAIAKAASVEQIVDYTRDCLIYELRAEILGEHIEIPIVARYRSITVPDGWWQHAKFQHKWLAWLFGPPRLDIRSVSVDARNEHLYLLPELTDRYPRDVKPVLYRSKVLL